MRAIMASQLKASVKGAFSAEKLQRVMARRHHLMERMAAADATLLRPQPCASLERGDVLLWVEELEGRLDAAELRLEEVLTHMDFISKLRETLDPGGFAERPGTARTASRPGTPAFVLPAKAPETSPPEKTRPRTSTVKVVTSEEPKAPPKSRRTKTPWQQLSDHEAEETARQEPQKVRRTQAPWQQLSPRTSTSVDQEVEETAKQEPQNARRTQAPWQQLSPRTSTLADQEVEETARQDAPNVRRTQTPRQHRAPDKFAKEPEAATAASPRRPGLQPEFFSAVEGRKIVDLVSVLSHQVHGIGKLSMNLLEDHEILAERTQGRFSALEESLQFCLRATDGSAAMTAMSALVRSRRRMSEPDCSWGEKTPEARL